ncbi:MAG: AAA family ATPase [Balneola sp.]|nr:MAG: AAA family ATPase [Balneola sp.]
MNISFGNRRLIGQHRAKKQLERILSSQRVSHAYLFSGPAGVGKTAFSLALAEAINGIDHLSDLSDYKSSQKSSWFTHPDIHVFIPKPTSAKIEELRPRLELLASDPYEIIGFAQRPSLTSDQSSKNLQAFYPVDYFREEIRKVSRLRPNEGSRVVIIITQVETMRKETANAFLKLLEEPNDRLMFILTTEHYEQLLPTITSRCQHIPLSNLQEDEIRMGLIEIDEVDEKDASYLARVSGGNYSQTRFFNADRLKEDRENMVNFLRLSFSQDAVGISHMAQDWQSSLNIEGMLALLNLMEMYIRDLMIYRETSNKTLVANIDQIDSIEKFVAALDNALLAEMMEEIDKLRPMLQQNVSPKLAFTALALRFSSLMRGKQPYIGEEEPWKHLPAFVE